MIGTGLAQALPFLATPILTRLYSQDDFARYTSFFAIATILSVAAGGRYYLAIVLPKKHEDALGLYRLSFNLTLLYVFLLVLILQTLYWLGLNQSVEIICFVPLYVLFYGIWISLIYLSIREKTFFTNAYSKVYQASGYIITAILFGLTKFSTYGLILAKILGIVGSVFYLSRKIKTNSFRKAWREYKQLSIKYLDYPKYSVVPAFLNTLSSQALILFLTKFYSTEDLGFYGLTYMVLSAPLGLIGTSYRDVFYQRIAELINAEKFSEGFRFFKKSAGLLFSMGGVIALVLYFFGPFIFGTIFGKEWIRSGEFASILALSFLVKLVASPLSSIFNATNRIKSASIWQTAYFVTTFTTLGLGCYVLHLGIIQLLYLYLVHEVVLYIIYFVLEYRMIQKLTWTK